MSTLCYSYILCVCLMWKKVNEECKLVHPCIPFTNKGSLCVKRFYTWVRYKRISIEISFSLSIAVILYGTHYNAAYHLVATKISMKNKSVWLELWWFPVYMVIHEFDGSIDCCDDDYKCVSEHYINSYWNGFKMMDAVQIEGANWNFDGKFLQWQTLD